MQAVGPVKKANNPKNAQEPTTANYAVSSITCEKYYGLLGSTELN